MDAVSDWRKNVCRDMHGSEDPFYSESNIRYLERKKREIDEGRAHLAEHDLIEVEDQ